MVDVQLWDEVQALLAENACGSSRRLKRQHPSLLTGKVIDGEGRQMSPSHATKGCRRYRYYITRSDQLDGSRAWRVSAHDFEKLVCSSLAEKLLEQQFVLELTGEGRAADAERFQKTAAASEMAAATLRSGSAHIKAEFLAQLVRQVRLYEDRMEVEVDREAARARLSLSGDSARDDDTAIITIPAVRVRRGHQLRLVVPGPKIGGVKPRRRDEKLIALIVVAQVARQLVLSNPEHSLARVAREYGRCRTRLGKLVALSCLAPNIITAIVEGKQPEHLTASRLLSSALPMAWPEQRRDLGLA